MEHPTDGPEKYKVAPSLALAGDNPKKEKLNIAVKMLNRAKTLPFIVSLS